MKPKLKAILFDMGGTLIEFENSSWEVLNQHCAKQGYDFLKKQKLIDIDYQNYVEYLRKEFEEMWVSYNKILKEINFESMVFSLFKKLNLNLTDDNKKKFMNIYYQPITEQLTLIPGAVETLSFFKNKRLKVGLLSNTIFPKRFHSEELKRFGLLRYLDVAVFSSDVGFKKPHPLIFQTALQILDTDPEFAAFVGDRMEEDIQGAHRLGMKTILKINKKKESSGNIYPDAEINNLTELPGAIIKLFDF
ncbi:MAG: HAD family hydrolase [Candidatus Zixiibacteriota bacterium]